MIDVGRELGLINKHVRRRNREAGEFVMWYQYDIASASQFDDIYDEGAPGALGRRYADPIKVPTIYVAENEDLMVLREDARKPTQTTQFTILVQDAIASGVVEPGRYEQHLNDVLGYDNKLYKLYDYHVRGRLKGEVVIGIVGYEVFMDEEFLYDPSINTSTNDLWPSIFPSI